MTAIPGANTVQGGWRIGDWTVRPIEGEVSRDGQVHRLEPKVMAVLACLAGRAGQVVSKDDILAEVWADSHVADVALARAVSEIRRVFGDDPKAPRYVETLARRGYRLVADVRPLSERGARPEATSGRIPPVLWLAAATVVTVGLGWALWPAPPAPVAEPDPITVAVLPFEAFGGDDTDRGLADGLTEDVIASLADAPEVRVTSRTSSMALRGVRQNAREIGDALGAAALIEGSVRRDGNRLIVVGQLIDTATDEHIWAETFERDAADATARRDVARQIAVATHVRLGPLADDDLASGQPEDVRDFYRRGRQAYDERTADGADRAVALLEQAVSIAPEFAAGHAALADARTRVFQFTRDGGASAAAIAAADRALAIDPESAEGHKARGYAHAVIGINSTAAEAYERAVARRRSYWQAINNLAILFNNIGRQEDAYRWMREAVLIDASQALTRTNFGEMLRGLGYDTEARAWFESALSIDPGYVGAIDAIAVQDLLDGRLAEARRRLEPAARPPAACRVCIERLALIAQLEHRWDDARAHIDRLLGTPGDRVRARLWRARLEVRDGRPVRDEDVAQLAREYRSYVANGSESWQARWTIAAALAVQGEVDEAMDWYARAVDAGRHGSQLDAIDPVFDFVRDDPRFEQQLQRIRDRTARAREALPHVMLPPNR